MNIMNEILYNILNVLSFHNHYVRMVFNKPTYVLLQ